MENRTAKANAPKALAVMMTYLTTHFGIGVTVQQFAATAKAEQIFIAYPQMYTHHLRLDRLYTARRVFWYLPYRHSQIHLCRFR